jgi:transmembrane protein TMEM260 (protein O-mannosyltransferase)
VSAALVFLVTFVVYVAGLAPDVYWLDSSELAAAAWGLGVAHPPGHPLPSLLGRACALLPFGSIAFRVGLASALAGAAAAAQTTRLGTLVARRARLPAQSDAGIDEWLGAAAGLTFGLSYAAAFQAVRPEVYALNALLVLTVVYELCRFDETGDRRRVLTAALAGGLALSNHHLLALTVMVPAALAFAWPAGARTSLRAVVLVVVVIVAIWAYLPLRAAAHPLVNWGAPTTLGRIFWTVSARAFQKSVAQGEPADVAGVAVALAGELWLVGAFAALGGAYVLVRLGRRRLALMLLGGALLDASTRLFIVFDPGNPDAWGYLETAIALLAALACGLVSVVAAQLQRPRFLRGVAVVIVAALVAGGAATFSRISRATFWDTGATLARFLDAAPPRARVVTSDFQTIFALWYLDGVEQRRPDVEIVHRHFLAYPGYRDEIARRVGDVSREPDVVEYDLDLPDALLRRSTTIPVVGDGDTQTRRYGAWQAYLGADRACRIDRTSAEPALQRARMLLAMPALNCDHVRDPVTIGAP